MKFYEFGKEYEYYALITVVESEKYPMDTAIKAYAEEIEGGMEEYNENYENSTPDEITRREAYKKFKKACISNYSNLSELIQAFQKAIKLEDENYSILLIDGNLC